MNTTNHPGRLRKIRRFLHLLGTVITPVGSIRATSKAHLVNQFLSTVWLNPVSNLLFLHCQIGHCHAPLCRNCGTDSREFPTWRRCCRIFVHCWRDIADRGKRANSVSSARCQFELIFGDRQICLKHIVSIIARFYWSL